MYQDTLCNRTLVTSYFRAAMMDSTLEFHLLLFYFAIKLDVDVYLNFLGSGIFFSSCFPCQAGQVWLQTSQKNILVWSLCYFCLLLFCLLQCMCSTISFWGVKPHTLNFHWALSVCQIFDSVNQIRGLTFSLQE